MAAFPRPTALAVAFVVLAVACSGEGEPPSATGRTTPSASPPPSSVPTGVSAGLAAGPGEPAYEVSLRANADGTRWSGSQHVAFTNTGAAVIRRIWLRAWANGVQGCEPLAIEVSAATGAQLGASRLGCTAIPLKLTHALAPGERTAVGFDLTIAVPERNDRFGHHGGLSLLGNALPTLAVLDVEGWHLDPYVDIGESFFSVVGKYRVSLDVPSSLRTPATGSLLSTETSGQRETRTYLARDVRDFAWAAGPLRSVRGDADGVTVTVWYRTAFLTTPRAKLVLRDSVEAVMAYADAFGALPYPRIDVVTAEFVTFQGMEYPRLVFANPERRVLAHELAHQWWYAIVGNDQYASPWLDESFATWASMLPWTPWIGCHAYDWPSAQAHITNDMGYWGAHPNEYATVYEGGGCMLADLADRFGLQAFTGLLAGHAADHWLGFASTADFQRRIERAAAHRLDGFDAEAYWETWRVA